VAGMTRNEAFVLGGLGVVVLGLMAAGSKMAPGGSVKVPARAVEDWAPFTPPPGRPVLGPDQHLFGYVFTPHRYPPACGSDISVLIHHGLSPAMLPSDDEMTWVSSPPGEGTL